MGRHDFKVWIAGKPWPRAPEFPYVVDDVAWASRHGYGSDIERRLEELKKADPNQRYVVRLSPQRQKAYSQALHGEHPGSPGNMTATVPTGGVVGASSRGCIAEAQREVYGDLAGWFQASTVTNNLAGTRAGLVTQDPQFLGALRRWSRCMHAGGYPYANPGEARAAVPTVKRRRTRKLEIRVAVAEATCAVRTGLAATARRLDRHYAAVVRKQYRSDVVTKRRMELAALPRARAVIGSK
jgi:hypothetical protein